MFNTKLVLGAACAPLIATPVAAQIISAQTVAAQTVAAQTAAVSTPLDTIIVLGEPTATSPEEFVVDPVQQGRLATLNDLFRGTPGLLVEPVFGGIDHPRFSIRGSGLQRGTQPAGRGIELRLDGTPMTYADTSFDFVEWIDPLLFSQVTVLRGGRGALDGGAALGGVVDFTGRAGDGDREIIARAEGGSFDFLRGQLAVSGGSERTNGFASATWFSQNGFREHNEQEAARVFAKGRHRFSDALAVRGSFLYSDSELELPGPQTLAQIEAGSNAAQPNNVAGDWRRFAERLRLSAGASANFGARTVELDGAFMTNDVEFRRRDVQTEDNEDLALALRYRDDSLGERVTLGVNVIAQRNERRQRQFFNGGGTPPSFTGRKGDQWADNDLEATRVTAQARASARLAEPLTLDLAAGWDWHGRKIEDNFEGIRPERPLAELDRDYDGFNGLALISWETAPGVTLFAGASHVIEPPTYDVLLINRSGAPGPMNALLTGADPRRPLIRDLDEQSATTLEGGARGRLGRVIFDATVYAAWLDGEIVSATDAVTQNVTSVGNADETRRFGVETSANADLWEDLLRQGDRLSLGVDWTYTDARFEGDPVFGDNQLPIIVEHLIEHRLSYVSGGLAAELFVVHAPEGGFADYANTVRAEGYATLGARLSYETDRFLIFAEGRNITDAEYVSSVIGARNNLAGMDNAAFAPGEPAAFTIGAQAKF